MANIRMEPTHDGWARARLIRPHLKVDRQGFRRDAFLMLDEPELLLDKQSRARDHRLIEVDVILHVESDSFERSRRRVTNQAFDF